MCVLVILVFDALEPVPERFGGFYSISACVPAVLGCVCSLSVAVSGEFFFQAEDGIRDA